jgi:hypothetical protein
VRVEAEVKAKEEAAKAQEPKLSESVPEKPAVE